MHNFRKITVHTYQTWSWILFHHLLERTKTMHFYVFLPAETEYFGQKSEKVVHFV